MMEADTVTDNATNRRLFIGGLFPEITEDELRQRFKTFGNVSSVEIKIRKDNDGTPLKTFAYVDIETNDADFKKLMNSYNKTKWRGSELKIQKAKENFLLRLEQERQQQKEELEHPGKEKSKTLKLSTDVQNKLLDIAGVGSVANMKPDGAKPGSTIPGHKDWIVGKYGRVLPIVQMKKNYMTKPMKIDPSKFTHTVKKLKETDDRTKSCVNLTWQLEERENEITKKRKGEFPAWKPEKKRCADFDEIQQKLQEIISRHMVEGDMAEMEVVPVAGIGEATKISTTNTKNVLVTKQAGLEEFDTDTDSDEDRTQAGYRGDANLDLSRFDSDDDDNDGGSKPNVAFSEKTKLLPNKSGDLPKNNNKDKSETISKVKTVGSVVSKVADSKPDSQQSKAQTKAVKATPKLIEGKKKLTEFRGLKFMSKNVPVETDIKPVKEVEKAPVIVFDIDDNKNVPGKTQNKRVYNSSDEDDDIDLNKSSVSNKIVASKKPKTNFSVSETFASQYSFTNEFASGIIEGGDNVESVTNRFGDNDSNDDDDDSDFESLVRKEMSKMNSSSSTTQSETRVGPHSLSISTNENKTVSKVKDTKSMTTPESVKHSETVLREGINTVSKSNGNVVGSQKGCNVKVSATISSGNKVVVDNKENDSSSEDDVSDDNKSDKNVANINVKGDDDDDASDDENTDKDDDDDDDSGESDDSDGDDDESYPASHNNKNVKTDVPIPGEIVDDSSDDDDDNDDETDYDSDSESEEISKAKNSAITVDDKDDDDNDDSSDSESEDEKEVVVKKQANTAFKNTGIIPTAKTQKEDENSDASKSDEDDDSDDSDDDDSDDDSNDENESDASSNFEQTIRKALNGTKSIAQPFTVTTLKDENKRSKSDDKENAEASDLKGKVVTGNESSSEDSNDSSDSEAENIPDIVTDQQKNVKDDTDSSESEDDDSESGENNIVVDVGKKEASKSGTNMNKDIKDDSESSETESDSDDDGDDDDDDDDDDNDDGDEIQIKSKTVTKVANNDELVKNDDSDLSESDSETDDDDDDGDKQVKSETVKNCVVTQKSNLRMTETLNKIERKQVMQSNNRNTSQKPDNMSGRFRQTGKIFEQTENKEDTDRKRLEAVKLRQQENKAQQSLIQTALANIDKGAPANNKIVFDSDSENDTVAMETDAAAMDTQENKQNTDSADILAKLGFETESKGKSLFDSSDDSGDDDDGDRFKIRQEFEGTGGKKLATLQSRYGNDERFKLDSRFIESDSEEEVPEIEIEDETQRSLKILQSVVGVKAMRGVSKMDKAKKQFKDIGTLKYDPTKQEHQQQFEIKTAPKEQPIQEPKSKKKKKKKDLPVEEVPEVELPEVSKDKFYEVSDSLKNTFIEKAHTDTQSEAQTGTGFSLLSTFGKNQSGDKSQNEAQSGGGFSLLSMFGHHTSDDEKSDNEAVAIPIPQTLRTNQMSLDNRFKVVDDSEDDDDDDDDSGVDNQQSTDDEKFTASKNKQDITEKAAAAMTTTVSKPSTFFFLPDDVRLKDTAKTSEPADTDKKSWFEKRRHLIDSYKSKYNNYKRKHKDDKKHGGGPRRGRGGRRR